ncbi:MAG: FAD-binding oxidoreductase, partial [Bdellovibrionales bacterium]|nr:FAD-binding oxidoreductase [Bdellovibrionales bacterium]
MSKQQPEVVIIGAGILGISLAYHLARRGRTVVVLERESTYGAHASGKTAGMFRQLYRNPQLTEWAKRSRES